ncbi:MAG: hypothetical protein LBH60_01260 [Prevotellaceae bacterium]|nr:hypothetical protein [Prevotellaceae bacterium]
MTANSEIEEEVNVSTVRRLNVCCLKSEKLKVAIWNAGTTDVASISKQTANQVSSNY